MRRVLRLLMRHVSRRCTARSLAARRVQICRLNIVDDLSTRWTQRSTASESKEPRLNCAPSSSDPL